MIGVALGLVLIGLVFAFVIPWVGIPVGVVGAVLLALSLASFNRQSGQYDL